MTLAILNTLPRHTLLAIALTLGLSGCESLPAEDAGNAISTEPLPTNEQTPATKPPATLDALSRNTQLATPATLFSASMAMIKLNRLTDAGVLYQEGQIRRLTDLRRFPPSADAQPMLREIERLKDAASAALGPKLLDKPRLYGLIAERLEGRDCNSGIGYEPAWAYTRSQPGVSCEAVHRQKVRLMRDLSVLLSQPAYAEAAQLAEYYQSSSSSVRELAGLREGYLKAMATMRKMERQQKRLGLSQRL